MTKTTNKEDANTPSLGQLGDSNFLASESLNNLNGPPTHSRTHSHPVSFSSFFMENDSSGGSGTLEGSSNNPNSNFGISLHPSSSLTDLLSLNIPPVPIVPVPAASSVSFAPVSSSPPSRTSPGSIPPSAMLQYLDNSPPPHHQQQQQQQLGGESSPTSSAAAPVTSATTPPYEVSQVLENFNALLECLDNNEIVEDIPGEFSSALQQAISGSSNSSSATRIKASVEAFAEMLLSGGAECEDDEDLLIVVDENDESCREEEDRDDLSEEGGEDGDDDCGVIAGDEDLQDELQSDEEDPSGVPRPRASMRKLRPVKLKPLRAEERVTADVLVQVQQSLSEIPEGGSPLRESSGSGSVTVIISEPTELQQHHQRSQSRTGSESSSTLEGVVLVSSNPGGVVSSSSSFTLSGGDSYTTTRLSPSTQSNVTTVNINSQPPPSVEVPTVISNISSANSSSTSNTSSSSPQPNGDDPPAVVVPPPVPARDPSRRSNTGGTRRLSSGSNRWPHRLSSVLALIGCTLGLNGICRFGLLSVSYGANFILQFVLLSVAFGIPLLTFHMSIGQYLSSGIVDMWKISPIFQGIGAGLLISQGLIGLYTSVGVSWMFIYFRDSFVSRDQTYRWARCVRERKDCEEYLNDSSSFSYFNQSTPGLINTVPDYFNGVVLQRSGGGSAGSLAASSSSLKFTVAFNLAVVWMLIFVSLSKGLRSYGKVVHGFVLAPIAALFILAFKMVGFVSVGSTLFGQTAWDEFFFNTQTWVVAAREVFFTWGLLGACIMQVTSHNKHGHPLKSDAAIVVMVTTLCLLLTAFIANTCFSVITAESQSWDSGLVTYLPSSFEVEKYWRFLKKRSGGMSTSHYPHNPLLMGVRIITPEVRGDSSASGYQVLRLATELFPTTVAILSPARLSPFWTVLFYGTLVLFGIAQQLAIWHCVIKGIIGIKSKLLKSWETTITFFICGLGFVLGLPFCTETGIFVTYLLDFAIGSAWWIMVLYLLQLVAVFIVRGAPYCGENIVTVLVTGTGRLTRTVAPLLSFVWNVVMPVALLVLSIASFKSGNARELYDWSQRGYRFWPSWTREVGCLIQLIPLLAVPFVAIIQSCRYLSNGPPDFLQRMQQLYRPSTTLGSGSSSTSGSDRNGNASGANGGRSEDPPPKYTPPPSYSTATGAKIARFLRNSFRRSLRRLGSPGGGAGGSSSSHSNLPPPPNYASVILEIQSQLNAANQSEEAHPPPPLYAEVTAGSSKSSGSSKFQMCQTLERPGLTKERSSLRRIASDLTARDIARMLRASFRRTNNPAISQTQVTVETHHQPTIAFSTVASSIPVVEPIPGPSYVFSALSQADGSRNRNSNASTAALIGYDFGSEDTETLDIRTFPRSRVTAQEDLEDYNAAIIRLYRTEDSLGLPSHSEA